MKTKNAEGRRFLSSAVAITVVVAIFTFLSLLPNAFAANPVIFHGNVISGSQYNTTIGEVFTVSYVSSEQKLIIDFPGESFVIESNTCTTGKIVQGCFDGAVFKGYNRSLPDPEVYEAKLTLSMVVPEIKIVKLLGKEEVEVGEETTASVNVTNTGAAMAIVYFTEKIPAELKLAELPGQRCQLSSGNTLVLTGDLTVGEMWRCDYKVTALSPGTHVIKSSAAFDVIKRETVEASASLKVKDLPFSVTATYPSALLLGEKFNITLVLKSDKKLDSLKFSAFTPAQMKVLSVKSGDVIEGPKHTTEKQAGGLKILNSDRLTNLNGSVEIIISSEAVAVGEFLISTNSSWSFDSLKQGTAKDFQVNATFAKPYFRLSKYDNKTGQASIDVVNPAHLPIFNISLSFGSFTGLNNQPLVAGEISSLSHAGFDIALKTQTPEVAGGGSSSNYSGEIRYYTLYGQELTETAALPINASQLQKTVMPAEETSKKASEAEQPAAEENKTGEAGEGIIREPVNPKRKSGFAGFRVAAAMVGIIIILIVIFLMLRAKKEEKEEETELVKAEEEEEKPDFEKY
ncbi:hypothetical protein HYV85_06360 [Candidatus Woesearchaeota archaeon]|nr:hypothetical protein [Candidatus Woesearchaeota archaeon]